MLLWYYVVVFKPIIPNLCYATNVEAPSCYIGIDDERRTEREKHGTFVSVIVNNCFYEKWDDMDDEINSSISLLITFCFSLVVMNSSFALYYNDRLYHDTMIALGIVGTAIPMILQSLIFAAKYKGRATLDQKTIGVGVMTFWSWMTCIGIWLLVSIILSFTYMPYYGWKVDSSYPETSMMRDVFFVVQGVPGMIALIGGIIIGLFYLFRLLRDIRCCQWWRDEITNAENQVKGFSAVECPITAEL